MHRNIGPVKSIVMVPIAVILYKYLKRDYLNLIDFSMYLNRSGFIDLKRKGTVDILL